MTEKWDRFQAFQKVKKLKFVFKPSRFEIWMGGKMIENGNVSNQLMASNIKIGDEEKMVVHFDEPNLYHEIAPEQVFDEFITANDRLQLLIIPNETNSENMALVMFKAVIGPTRKEKNFSNTEAFCCNLFLKNQIISKITFSFSNPEKLVELYQ